MTNYEKLYKENADFRLYVDRAAKADGETVEKELTKAVVRNVGDYYVEKTGGSHVTETTINVGCGGC